MAVGLGTAAGGAGCMVTGHIRHTEAHTGTVGIGNTVAADTCGLAVTGANIHAGRAGRCGAIVVLNLTGANAI